MIPFDSKFRLSQFTINGVFRMNNPMTLPLHFAAMLIVGACAPSLSSASPPSPMEGCARTFASTLIEPPIADGHYEIQFLNRGVVMSEAEPAGVDATALLAAD
jgi:hypothetical protein